MMKKLTPREKKIAILCLVLMVVYVFFQFFIRPSKKRDQGLSKTIAEKLQVFEKNNKTLSDSKMIEEKAKTYLELFAQKGSDEQETSVMISDVEDAAGKKDIQITNMQPQKALVRDGYSVIGIQIVISGSLLTIAQFVHELQDRPYFFDVSEVQLEKSFGPDAVVRGRLTLTKIRFKSAQ